MAIFFLPNYRPPLHTVAVALNLGQPLSPWEGGLGGRSVRSKSIKSNRTSSVLSPCFADVCNRCSSAFRCSSLVGPAGKIWQQVVRSSDGSCRLYPCAVDSVDRMPEYESEVNKILVAVYDQPQAYSLRDRDAHPELIADEGLVTRLRLSCRAAENLMLSDEALALAETDWPQFQKMVQDWAQVNTGHKYHAQVREFVDNDFDRKNANIKSIRNILLGLMTNKPWEVLVGQAIAKLVKGGRAEEDAASSLKDFLGQKVCERLLHLRACGDRALPGKALSD